MSFIKLTKYNPYLKKLETTYVNKKNVHSVEYYNSPEVWKEVTDLGIKGEFVLLEVKYTNVVTSDIVIFSTIEKFMFELELN